MLILCWTNLTPSFALSGGVRGAGARRLVLLPCLPRSLRAARWRARSWSWTAGVATLMDEVNTSLCSARQICGAGAGRLVPLPCWTRPTPAFSPPGGWLELELDGWCCRPAGRGQRLPSRCQVAFA